MGPKPLIDLLRQRSRPYLFSNSLPPPVVGSALRALELLLASSHIAQSMAAKTMRWGTACKGTSCTGTACRRTSCMGISCPGTSCKGGLPVKGDFL